jgi:Flp pilus assembly protein TadD
MVDRRKRADPAEPELPLETEEVGMEEVGEEPLPDEESVQAEAPAEGRAFEAEADAEPPEDSGKDTSAEPADTESGGEEPPPGESPEVSGEVPQEGADRSDGAEEATSSDWGEEPEPWEGGRRKTATPGTREEAASTGTPSPLPPATGALNRARELARAGKTQEAIQVYGAIVAENPLHIKARNNLGVLYDEIGAHELALEQFEAARQLDSDNVEILTNLGASLGALGRFDDAEREFRKALKINPENVDLRANLGILFFRRGLYGQAEVELRWVCERDENHATAHFYRGEALNRLGRVEEALEALNRATLLQPGNARAYYTLGILYDKKHLPEQAEQMYRKSRELGST